MSEYFTGPDGPTADESIVAIEEIFHLEDQLARLEETP
jgi:hypothetical protein